jgi:hypothetical protein
MLEKSSIEDVSSTSKTPTVNTVCGRIHQRVGNRLQTLAHGNPPKSTGQAGDLLDEICLIEQHALFCVVHTIQHARYLSRSITFWQRHVLTYSSHS